MVELLCVNSVINQDKVPIPNSSTWFFLVLQQHLILFKSINVFVLSSNEEKQRKQLMGNKLLLQLLLLLPLLHAYSGISTVRYLPGYHGPLPFELETGYIGVGEAEESQFFYYFIKSERTPAEDPLLIWLTGGPGCSSISGFLLENGPLAFNTESDSGNIPSLVSTTYSWSKVANIIYLDQPVDTGFSYSRNPLANIPSDTRSAKLVHEFVHKWLAKHPEYFSNPFYVTGNSYAGKVVPATVQEISIGNGLCCKPQINLQGYVLGNPITDLDNEKNWHIPFAHGMALISDEHYESLRRSCRGNYAKVDPLNTECMNLVEEFEKCVSGLDWSYILGPKYINPSDPDDANPLGHRMTVQSNRWTNEESVRRALHVEKGTIGEWSLCDRELPYKFDINSSVPYHKNNSIQGYRSLIFSGDHDLLVPFLATQDWMRSLNYSIVEDWRPWMVHNQVAGYTRTYANKMTFATVKGGGHTIVYKPDEYSAMFKRWINGQPL
ncbi:serine carboxypeptidase-like 15 [Brassica rapa]|nr:serine carboxypeptidase-like 15 isoform X2 [Brassica rapa]XP_033144417.1 serine carboxypeptidase-like 15 [Brassica rapa]